MNPESRANGLARGVERFSLPLSTVLVLCENINTVRSLTVYLLLKYGEYDQYVQLDLDPSRYSSPTLLMDDYQVTRILSKHIDLPTSFDRRGAALDSFKTAEAVCAESNVRLSRFAEGIIPDADIFASVHHAREYIRNILGGLTRKRLTEVYDKCKFGPGSTTSLGGVVTLGKKFSRRVNNVSPRLLDFALFCRPPGWQTLVNLSPSGVSKVRVVPKNAKTDRTICIEDDLNIFVQLGIGSVIRSRLALFGLDLNTQAINQELACRASIDDSLCTMDLSSASDLICREVVWLLLPFDWASLLHFARTDMYELDGEKRTFEKWSSMGNGYTFELESLLFYGILLGCSEVGGWSDQVVAYGDDLIFPSHLQPLVTRTLEFLGFKVNREKTFGKGLFRESCGTDWFAGHNVRPTFWKGQQDDQTNQIYSYANSLRRWAFRRNGESSCDARVLPSWLRLFTATPRRDRFRIPEGFGDVGFITNCDEAHPSRHSGSGWSGWSFRYRIRPPKRSLVDMEGALIGALHTPSDFCQGIEPLRGRFSKATTRLGYSLEWPDLGPWL